MRALTCAAAAAFAAAFVSCLDVGYGEDARCYANEDCAPETGAPDAQVDLDDPEATADAGEPDAGVNPGCQAGTGRVFQTTQPVTGGTKGQVAALSPAWAGEVHRLCYASGGTDGGPTDIHCAMGLLADGGPNLENVSPQPNLTPVAGSSATDPSLTADGEYIFYVEQISAGARQAYVARWEEAGGYGATGRAKLPLTMPGPITGVDVSGDGTMLVFAQEDEQTLSADIYLAWRPVIGNDFAPPVKLAFNTADNDISPALNHDGTELLFTRPAASSTTTGGYRFGRVRACDGWSTVDWFETPPDPNGGSAPPQRPEWGPGGRIFFDHVGAGGTAPDLLEALP